MGHPNPDAVALAVVTNHCLVALVRSDPWLLQTEWLARWMDQYWSLVASLIDEETTFFLNQENVTLDGLHTTLEQYIAATWPPIHP